MKRKFNIELNLTSPIQKITGFENIKKHVDIEISPLDDFFTENGIQHIIAKLYYFLFHYYAYTKIKIDINDVRFIVKGELIKSSKLGGLGIELFVVYKKKKIIVIKNPENTIDKLIKNPIDKKISDIEPLSFISLTPINFIKEIKGKIRIFGATHPINKSSKLLIPILRDFAKYNNQKKLNTELSFMLHPKTAQIIMILFMSHDKEEGRNGLAFFEIADNKREWMKTLYFSNIYNIKDLFTFEDFVNEENYGIILDNLKVINY